MPRRWWRRPRAQRFEGVVAKRAELDVPARPALAVVGQGEVPLRAGDGGRRLQGSARATGSARSGRCSSGCTTTPAVCSSSARSAPDSTTARCGRSSTELRAAGRPTSCPFAVSPKLPGGSLLRWVRPELVAQVGVPRVDRRRRHPGPGVPRPPRRQGPERRRPRDVSPRVRLRPTCEAPSPRGSGRLAGAPDLLRSRGLGLLGLRLFGRGLRGRRLDVVVAVLVTDGWRPLASRASARLASSAAARSMTVPRRLRRVLERRRHGRPPCPR